MNVILLTVDALRADHLSSYGYGRDTSPMMDEIALNGLRFSNAFATSSHTRESVPSILTGHYPNDAINDDYTLAKQSLGQILSETHATAAFHSNPYISRAYGYNDGYGEFHDDMYLGQNRYLALLQRGLDKYIFNRGEYHARAEEINRRSLDWLGSLPAESPFFLWNHYMDVHGPYNPPRQFSFASSEINSHEAQELYHRINDEGNNVKKKTHDLAVDLYDGEIRYLDDCIRQFVSILKERGILSESLLIITSDHGDLFGEYGQFGHPRYVYPELTQVPLILSNPKHSRGTIDRPVSTIDILPTILEMLNISVQDLPGQSLHRPAPGGEQRTVFSSATGLKNDAGLRRFAAWDGFRGYLFTREVAYGEVSDELAIDLSENSVVDLERQSANEKSKYESLRETLLIHSKGQLDDRVSEEADDIDQETLERLKSLGYK